MYSQAESHAMLSFQLTPQLKALISVDELIGLATVETSNITPIPDAPQSVMGIYSYRGRALWIIDLPCLLGLTPLYLANTRQVCSIIFLQADHQIAGFAISQVGQIFELHKNQLQRDYASSGVQRLNWCIDGMYSKDNNTLLFLQGDKIFKLLKISEMAM